MNTDEEDFWGDVMAHIRTRVLVPVVGPDVTTVESGGTSQPLTRLIGQRLVDYFRLVVHEDQVTTSRAVDAFLRARGRDEAERLYRIISDIIDAVDGVPGAPLRDLATVTDLRLLVSTTPDRLLAQAVEEVRFNGRGHVHELAFSPSQSTTEQSRHVHAPGDDDVVVLRLFGKATSTPQYAIHDEDRLEWIHALLSDTDSLPDWLAFQLKHQPLLFIGCDMPDWLGRMLLRMSSNNRLWLESKQFFIVGRPSTQPNLLSEFFTTYCRKAQVQQLEMDPAAFVRELRERWEKQRPRGPSGGASGHSLSWPPPAGTDTIFISYIREDADVARRLYAEVAALGGDVWMDERELHPGDAWRSELLTTIRRKVRLFIPVISANTERAREGFVFREWAEAAQRSREIPRSRFVIPVVVDDDFAGDLGAYRQIPEDFFRYHIGCAPAGRPDADLLSILTAEIREMRRRGVA
jgi:hypothetical protein